MSCSFRFGFLCVALLSGYAAVGCGSDNAPAGAPAAGGAAGQGGSAGQAGASAGGSAGSQNGGAAGVGGTAGSSGTAGNGGSAGAGGAAPEPADYYVATTGDDANPGTLAEPFKTIEKAFSVAGPGTLVYVRGGVYAPADSMKNYGFRLTGKAGSASSMIRVWAFPGELPVLDCSSMTYDQDSMFCLHIVDDVSFVHLKGFEVKALPQLKGTDGHGFYEVGVLLAGTDSLLENLSVHDIGGSGINISGIGNTVLNCDMFRCYDPYTYNSADEPYPGGNADGLHVTIDSADTAKPTIISGCRMWDNSDDGLDCFNTDGVIRVENTWVWHNGYIPGTNTPSGDGEGLKLGRTTATYNDVRRYVHNCVAVSNRASGMSANNGLCGMSIVNNTSYENVDLQYTFGFDVPNVSLHNNVAFGGSLAYIPYATHDHNSWDSSVTVTADDFASLDASQLGNARKADGSLPDITFLHLAAGSDLAGAGSDLGYGTNLGAF